MSKCFHAFTLSQGFCWLVVNACELYYQHEGKWELLVAEEAKENELNLKDMPVGGLYVLRNVTKGHEERIFTYVNSQQVWW